MPTKHIAIVEPYGDQSSLFARLLQDAFGDECLFTSIVCPGSAVDHEIRDTLSEHGPFHTIIIDRKAGQGHGANIALYTKQRDRTAHVVVIDNEVIPLAAAEQQTLRAAGIAVIDPFHLHVERLRDALAPAA